MRPLKKLKMKRYFKAACLISLITFFTACKSDDDVSVTPPRDYGEQYITEKAAIEDYLHTHYIVSVSEDMDVEFAAIPAGGTQTSIWDQTEYELLSKAVNSNDVDYTVYYLVLREGVGQSPTRADKILTAYRGILLDGTQFDYLPYPQTLSSLSETIEGWQEIIPMFKTGTYDATPGPNPVTFEDYGAGVMFLPSGLGYYNSPVGNISSYSTLIFSFKLYELEYVDTDGDGILSKDETEPGIDIADYDTDGDGTPNYLDTDDDGDGYLTLNEITDPLTGEPYPLDEIPTCPGNESGIKRHLDPSCHQ